MKKNHIPALLFKLVAVVVYDGLVIFGIALFLSLITVILVPQHEVPPETLWFQLMILAGISAYITASLKMGGQTLGMKTWKLHWNGLKPRSWPVAFALVVVSLAAITAILVFSLHMFFGTPG